jgi:protease PrsW
MALAGLATLLLLIGFEVGTVALVTGIVLALLPVPVYVGLALWVDRFEPEPAHLLLWAFFWGATGATLIALVINSTGQAFVGGAFGSEVGQLYGASLSAPVVEEVAKAAALYGVYRWRRLEFDGVLDGLVYAGMVGLGFAFSENILYYSRAALEGGVPLALTFFVRGVLSPFGHPVFTAATGIGVGLAALRAGVAWRSAPIVGLLGAMGLHSLWNTSAGVAGGAGFPAVYFTVMIPVFAGLVAIAVAALFRDRSVIQRYLQPELASWVLSAEDLAILTSLRERRRAVRLAKRQSAAARRARKELQRAPPSWPSCAVISTGVPRPATRRGRVRRPPWSNACARCARSCRRSRLLPRPRRRAPRSSRPPPPQDRPPRGTPTPTGRHACGGGTATAGRSTPPSERRHPRRLQTARSMKPPQLRHTMFAVSDMRAMVECAPQLGHSERSSYRLRQ